MALTANNPTTMNKIKLSITTLCKKAHTIKTLPNNNEHNETQHNDTQGNETHHENRKEQQRA
jgi:hypothetical protein